MGKNEFDDILQLLQNPTRRRILEILSREEHYPLQLSRTLNTSQQAVSKHLKTMERKGIVVSKTSKSEKGGPPTRTYTLNSEFSIRIDVGPALFETEVDILDQKELEEYRELKGKMEKYEDEDYLKSKMEVIHGIEEDIRDLERKRKILLKIKENSFKEAFNYIYNNFDHYKERNVLYYVISSGVTDPYKIAQHLNMRDEEVVGLLNGLKDKTNIW
ncbi:MAG: helix-turn-helix domain-containing protein [Thermoplasmata archaeon]